MAEFVPLRLGTGRWRPKGVAPGGGGRRLAAMTAAAAMVGAESALSGQHQGAAQVHGERQQLQLEGVPDQRSGSAPGGSRTSA